MHDEVHRRTKKSSSITTRQHPSLSRQHCALSSITAAIASLAVLFVGLLLIPKLDFHFLGLNQVNIVFVTLSSWFHN
jgi:hypothetical protein